MSAQQNIFPVCSGIIAATGLVTNLLSLTYFTRKPKRTMTTRIFLFLNTFDMLVCLVGTILVISTKCSGHRSLCGFWSPLFSSTVSVMNICVETTAFATCLLSVTRTVSLFFPFYQINRNVCGIAVLIFTKQELARFFLSLYFFFVQKSSSNLFHDINKDFMILLLSTAIICSFVSSSLSAWKLLSNKKKRIIPSIYDNVRAQALNKNQKATITILIVCTLFCILNTVFIINLYLTKTRKSIETPSAAVIFLHEFSLWLAVPLNSALNPAIYFIRKKEMRVFIKNILLNFNRILTEKS